MKMFSLESMDGEFILLSNSIYTLCEKYTDSFLTDLERSSKFRDNLLNLTLVHGSSKTIGPNASHRSTMGYG